MIFANIEYLFLLVLLIPYIIWYVMKRKKTEPTMQLSTTSMYLKAPKSWKIYLLHAPFVLRIIAIVMVILVLARPQTTDNWQNTEIEGIDIMLAVDVSTSMLAEDLKPNRLEAAKLVASEFINGRPNDNIGLTIFAGESFTQCPLTVDHGVLLNLFHSIKGDIAQRGLIEDGTAIGMGIANAVTRLKDSKAKSKVIILLTDGSNNRGDIASRLSKSCSAKTRASSVFPTPVGPRKRNAPMGLFRLRMPARERNTASETASTAASCPMTRCFKCVAIVSNFSRSPSSSFATGMPDQRLTASAISSGVTSSFSMASAAVVAAARRFSSSGITLYCSSPARA